MWLVELAAVSGEDAVTAAISAALGITEQPGRSALDTLLDALAPQDMLVVLDNCEHLIGSCAKAADAILRQCPRVRLVATSREPLGIGGEALYRVPPMSLPGPDDGGPAAPGSSDAVALFAERSKEQGVLLSLDGETGPLIASICVRLDGLPLAIELAAARLRSLSLSDLAGRLDQRFRLLTGGSRTAAARQQTLQAAVDWSYSLLNAAEQSLLGRLSVFAGGFDLAAAEAVCGAGDIERLEVTGLLGSLVDKSLVVADPAGPALRYRLLETIRQFAAERLAETGEDQAAVEAAHCAHYLGAAETAALHLTGPEQGRWLARLDADRANLGRAAVHAARDPAGTAQVLRLGAARRRYWITRFRDEEALALLRPALESPQAPADPRLFAAALVTAAFAARRLDIAAARRFGERAVKIARQLGAAGLLIESLGALSYVCYRAGEPNRGLALGQEAVERARQLGDDVLLGQSLADYLVSDALIHPAARAYLQQAARAGPEIGGEHLDLSINMGWVLRQDNDPGAARASFHAVLRISRRNGDRSGIAYACLGLACLAADDGDWYRAAVLHDAAQAFLDRTGQPWEELEARYRQRSFSQLATHLSQQQLEQAHATGLTLSSGQALDLASGKALRA